MQNPREKERESGQEKGREMAKVRRVRVTDQWGRGVSWFEKATDKTQTQKLNRSQITVIIC